MASARETRDRKRAEAFGKVTIDLLEFEASIIEAIKENGITTVMDFLALNEGEISDLTYKSVGTEDPKVLPFYIRSKIRILQAWNVYLLTKLNLKVIDWMETTNNNKLTKKKEMSSRHTVQYSQAMKKETKLVHDGKVNVAGGGFLGDSGSIH